MYPGLFKALRLHPFLLSSQHYGKSETTELRKKIKELGGAESWAQWLCPSSTLCDILRHLWGLRGKESACQCRKQGFDPWVRKIPWRRKWLPTPVFLPGEFHGQRSQVGYHPQSCKIVGHGLATKQQSYPSPFHLSAAGGRWVCCYKGAIFEWGGEDKWQNDWCSLQG